MTELIVVLGCGAVTVMVWWASRYSDCIGCGKNVLRRDMYDAESIGRNGHGHHTCLMRLALPERRLTNQPGSTLVWMARF